MTDLETRAAAADAIVAELTEKLAALNATAEKMDDGDELDEVWLQIDETNDELEAAMYRADFIADE